MLNNPSRIALRLATGAYVTLARIDDAALRFAIFRFTCQIAFAHARPHPAGRADASQSAFCFELVNKKTTELLAFIASLLISFLFTSNAGRNRPDEVYVSSYR